MLNIGNWEMPKKTLLSIVETRYCHTNYIARLHERRVCDDPKILYAAINVQLGFNYFF